MVQTQVDIVIPYKQDHVWKGNELRYALRSVEKFLYNIGHIYIIGDDPGFLQNVTIIPFADASSYNKEKNIFEKILHACSLPLLSDNFLFMNDDHIILRRANATCYPLYHSSTSLSQEVEKRPAGNAYRLSLLNTVKALKKHHHAEHHFDVHTPVLYNKKVFPDLSGYDWDVSYGYVLKSLYHNTFFNPSLNTVGITDLKINTWYTRPEIERLLASYPPVLSLSELALSPEMKAWLKYRFPAPSRWEK